MNVKLQRKRPPDVYLLGTKIDVRTEASEASAAPLTRDFETLLANEMCRNDPRLHVDRTSPESAIQVTVTNLSARDRWVTRKSTEYKKVGTKQVWNDKKQKTETKDDYQNVEVTKQYMLVEGAITVTLRITEVAGGKVLHTATVSDNYNKEFLDGKGAPLQGQLPVMLMQSVVQRILPAVVPTDEMVEVQLAKGKFEDSSRLAQSGLWTRMLESLESMPAQKKPQDDAYRFYNMGVASEALAYQAESPGTAQKLLEQAAIHYGRAIDMKSDEKYFRGPQVRIQTAIAQLGKAEGQRALYSRSLEAKKTAADGGSRSLPAAGGNVLTNKHVIDLVRSGLDETNLTGMINEAPAVQFDLGPEGTMTLLKNNVTNRVIAVMRSRAARK